jgi:hypothetical protein
MDRIEFGNGFILEGNTIKNERGDTLTEDDLRELLKKKHKDEELENAIDTISDDPAHELNNK